MIQNLFHVEPRNMHFSILNVLRLDLGAVWALPLRKLVETHSQRKKKKNKQVYILHPCQHNNIWKFCQFGRQKKEILF